MKPRCRRLAYSSYRQYRKQVYKTEVFVRWALFCAFENYKIMIIGGLLDISALKRAWLNFMDRACFKLFKRLLQSSCKIWLFFKITVKCKYAKNAKKYW